MKTLRIFISSPGDVEEERDKAKQVISSLQREVGGDGVLVPVLWEDLAIPATASFQEGIDFVLSEKHRIDIAVFVLWSRLGSPLGACITKPDGSAYLSGTEREFDLMLSAFEQSGRKMPIILAYTRDDLGAFSDKLDARTQQEEALEELIRQRKLVKQFIHERFHDEQGRNLRAYHTYREPVGFAQRLHVHLREAVIDLLGRDYATAMWEGSPYRSLEVFDVQHAPIFFGRDEETCDVLQRLRDQQAAGCAFVCIVGASGSGKSSLARAGVAATLIQRSFEDGVREWRAASLIPGLKQGDLYLGLTRCLTEALPELRSGVGGLEKLAKCFEEQNHDAAGILIATAIRTARDKTGGPLRLLVVLDQMEELWTDRSITPEQREKFLQTLESLGRSGGISVLATLRSDFYPQAQLSEAFLRMKGERGHFDLTPPGPAALHQLIVQPARRAGLVFERDERTGRTLDQQILVDAAHDPSSLPLLQYALAELHEFRDDQNRLLTLSAYEAMGGVEGALGKRATQTFDSLSADVQAALDEMLPLLISVDIAGEQNAVRRRAPLDDLTGTPARRDLTQALVDARFLTTDDEAGTPIATLAHEALLRRWDRVRGWITSNRDLLRVRARVEQYQAMWEESGRNDSRLLPPGLPLEEGRQLLGAPTQMLDDNACHFVVESNRHQERRARSATRRRRVVASALSVLTVAASIAAIWALGQQDAAEQASKKADAERIRAEEALVETQRQLERSQLEEGRAWLERAKLAWESRHDPLTALMLAGRAVGFHGFGRRAEESQAFQNQFPSLIGAPMSDAANETTRQMEEQSVRDFVRSVQPTGLPIWSSPIQAHHRGHVTSVAFSPDGTRLASGSKDNTVKLWNVASGKELACLRGHSGGVNSVAFSPDGTRLASGSDDTTVKLWDVASGKELACLRGHSGGVNSVAFSPDGTRLASGSNDTTVKLWDVASGREFRSFEAHWREVTSIAFSHTGSLLASGSGDATVKLWDVAGSKELASLRGHIEAVQCVAFSSDSARLATGAELCEIKLWDIFSYEEITSLRGHDEGTIESISFSSDGTRLVSAGEDGTMKLWNVASGEELASLPGYSTSVAFSPDGTRLASGSVDHTVKLWDVTNGQQLASRKGHSETVNSVAFSPDGTRLASGSVDHTVKLWDVTNGQQLASLDGHLGDVESVAFSPDGSTLASGSWDHTVKLWDAATGEELATLREHSSSVASVAFGPDGTRLASGSWDHTVKLWDVTSGRVLTTLQGHSDPVTSVVFSPDGRRLASGSYDGAVKLWDVATSLELTSLQTQSNRVTSVAFSPDGSRVALGLGDDTVKLWDIATGEELATLRGHTDTVTSVAFSPDGSRLALGLGDDTVKLWDVASGRELACLRGHSGGVTSVAFSPDGSRLVSGSEDNTVTLWDVAGGKELACLRGHSGGVNSVTFSPSGTVTASGSRHGVAVKLWDVATGKELATFRSGQGTLSLAFNPDGSLLAIGCSGGTVQVWEIATGRPLALFEGHWGDVTSVAFSPDGSQLASRCQRGTKFWNLANGEELLAPPDFPFPAANEPRSPDGRLSAVLFYSEVFLRASPETVDLTQSMRAGYFSLHGHEVMWNPSDSLFEPRSFPVIHPRKDLVAQLGEPDLSPAHRLALRNQQAARCGAWRMLSGLWKETEDAGLTEDAELRPVLARTFSIAARQLAVAEEPTFPRELWEPLKELTDENAFSDLFFAVTLAQALPPFLNSTEVDPALPSGMKNVLAQNAPKAWLDTVLPTH